MKNKFIPGLELNRNFFSEIIQPIISENFPELKYTAGLVGYGSDVLGYDSAVSMDHCWGPRCVIFLENNSDYAKTRQMLNELMLQKLPSTYRDLPTKFTKPSELDGVVHLATKSDEADSHQIVITDFYEFAQSNSGCNLHKSLELKEWLTFSEQGLLEITAGEIYHDDLKTSRFRQQLAFYPKDVKLLKIAALWDLIANEEAFIGRRLEFGDYLGAKIIAVRVVNTLLKICFYLEERYMPYSKWFMTAINQLSCAKEIVPATEKIIFSQPGEQLDRLTAELAQKVMLLQNEKLALNLNNQPFQMYQRPGIALDCSSISNAVLKLIDNKDLKKLNLLGIAIEQKTDGLDFTDCPRLLAKIVEE